MEAFLSLNRDASSRIIRFIPFPALGRLAVTSKTINALVTKADINRALDRGKALFGKTEVVLQPPYDSFHGEGIGSCVRILDLEENVLEIGRKDTTSDLVTVMWDGVRFTGTPNQYKQAQLIHFLEDTVDMSRDKKEVFYVWFEIRDPATIRVKFCGARWNLKPTKEKPVFFDVRLLEDRN